MRITWIEETDSTNSYMARNLSELKENVVIACRRQLAGRGQRGNSWESEPNKNLTFSILLRLSDFPANRQFLLSESVAVAVAETLAEMGIDARVKWPNDIYWQDKKLAGILIEHAIMGQQIIHSIIGIGLNVNQQKFLSDAPNPVSMRQISGNDFLLQPLLESICSRISMNTDLLSDEVSTVAIHNKYMQLLWRNDNQLHLFKDTSSGEFFNGFIGEIEPTGHINIYEPESDNLDNRITESCRRHRFAFKEVEWIIE